MRRPAMRVCIYGAGAIGGYLGARLSLSGTRVTLIARGPHLEAIRQRGLTLVEGDDRHTVHPECTDDPTELEPQDVVIVTLKGHSVAGAAEGIRALLGPRTVVVTAQNGIPWWYFHCHPGPWDGRSLEAVDPGRVVWKALGPERALGCVVYPSCEIVEPGVIRHLDGNRFMLGEPDGSKSQRATEISRALTNAGLKAPVRHRIRDDIWLKLWGNVSFNPVSALTLSTLDRICGHPGTLALTRRLMLEAQAVALELGVRFPVDVDKRIQWAADVGAHRTSMLQDLLAGRPMEIEPVVGAVAELARLVSIPTPTLDMVLGLLRLRAEAH